MHDLAFLLCGCNQPVSLTDLKQPLLTLSTHAPDAFCDEYIAVDAQHSSPLFEGFDAGPGGPSTVSFIHTMKSLVP